MKFAARVTLEQDGDGQRLDASKQPPQAAAPRRLGQDCIEAVAPKATGYL